MQSDAHLHIELKTGTQVRLPDFRQRRPHPAIDKGHEVRARREIIPDHRRGADDVGRVVIELFAAEKLAEQLEISRIKMSLPDSARQHRSNMNIAERDIVIGAPAKNLQANTNAKIDSRLNGVFAKTIANFRFPNRITAH